MRSFVSVLFKNKLNQARALREIAELCDSYMPEIFTLSPEIWLDEQRGVGWVAWSTEREFRYNYEAEAHTPYGDVILGGYTTRLGASDIAKALCSGGRLEKSPGGVGRFSATAACRALIVTASSRPVAARPLARWKAAQAVWDSHPQIPSSPLPDGPPLPRL